MHINRCSLFSSIDKEAWLVALLCILSCTEYCNVCRYLSLFIYNTLRRSTPTFNVVFESDFASGTCKHRTMVLILIKTVTSYRSDFHTPLSCGHGLDIWL